MIMEFLQMFFTSFGEMFLEMSFYMMLGLFFVGLCHVYVPKEQVLRHLGSDGFGSVVKASLVGVPLPLCSCGVVPTAVELKKSGASNGAVISFLISTPQTGVDSIFATYSMMGWVMAIFRPIAAFASGMIGGAVINGVAKHEVIMQSDHAHEACDCHSCHSDCACCHEEVHQHTDCDCGCDEERSKRKLPRFLQVFTYAYGGFLDEIAVHFLIGMVIASLITTFVPTDLFVSLGLSEGVLAMLCMVIIGLPMYICSVSSIPIALALITKGLSLGSAFVFLFTGPVTNIASLLVLRKALGQKITGLYVACVVVCSLSFGLLLDALVKTFDFSLLRAGSVVSSGIAHADAFHIVIAVIFGGLIVKGILLLFVKK